MTNNELATAVLVDQSAMRAANLLMEHLPQVIAALRARPEELPSNDEMLRCLGFVEVLGEVKHWPIWICGGETIDAAAQAGWITELRREPFIPRMGTSFVVYGITPAGIAEFHKRLPRASTHMNNSEASK